MPSKVFLILSDVEGRKVRDATTAPAALVSRRALRLARRSKAEGRARLRTLRRGRRVAGFLGDDNNYDFNMFKAVGVFYVVPVLIVYALFHKYLMNIYGGGSKG